MGCSARGGLLFRLILVFFANILETLTDVLVVEVRLGHYRKLFLGLRQTPQLLQNVAKAVSNFLGSLFGHVRFQGLDVGIGSLAVPSLAGEGPAEVCHGRQVTPWVALGLLERSNGVVVLTGEELPPAQLQLDSKIGGIGGGALGEGYQRGSGFYLLDAC